GGVVVTFRCAIGQRHGDWRGQFTWVAQRHIKDGRTAFINSGAGDASNFGTVIVHAIATVINKRRRFGFAVVVCGHAIDIAHHKLEAF
ncbi:hypothetical protein ABS858_24105, partial [Vibrio neptunius]|uniref:hypothetical protein n=1 Tax=Vibrio neptunius TaxID=170651 RepID=UPI003314CACA